MQHRDGAGKSETAPVLILAERPSVKPRKASVKAAPKTESVSEAEYVCFSYAMLRHILFSV